MEQVLSGERAPALAKTADMTADMTDATSPLRRA